MTNDELLQAYINRLDQDQAALRQDLRDLAVRTDQRLDRMDAKMDRMETDFRNEFKEQKRFIVGTIIAAVGAAATVVALIMQFM